jgi:hypothetical protein
MLYCGHLCYVNLTISRAFLFFLFLKKYSDMSVHQSQYEDWMAVASMLDELDIKMRDRGGPYYRNHITQAIAFFNNVINLNIDQL